MSLGNNLYGARKRIGLSQEKVSEKLGVSKQTISKWETDERVPDICEAKKLAHLYNVSLDDLIEFDTDLKEIEQTIKNTNEEKIEKIDWTNAWSKKYPALSKYQTQVNVEKYAIQIRKMLNELQMEYDFNTLDSMLVLKDILYHGWNDIKS